MRILIIRTYPTIMKLATYNSQELGLAKAFTDLGHQCDIVYYNGFKKTTIQTIDYDGKTIKIFWLKSLKILNNGFFFGLKKLMKDYDYFQVSEYDQIISRMVYSKHPECTYVYQGVYDPSISKIHNIKAWFFDHFLLRKKHKEKTMIFTKSRLAEESIIKKGFKKVKTVGVGMDFSRFSTTIVSEKNKNLLYVGKLENRRNTLFLLETFSLFLDERPGFTLTIVGDGEPKYLRQIDKRIRDLGLEKSIIRYKKKNQEELPSLYSSSFAFLLPTRYEIFGMVLLESMYFKIPVVTSVNGGSSTLIPNSSYGIIVNNFSTVSWKNALEFLTDNPEKARLMVENAYDNVVNNFAWKNIAVAILQAIKERE